MTHCQLPVYCQFLSVEDRWHSEHCSVRDWQESSTCTACKLNSDVTAAIRFHNRNSLHPQHVGTHERWMLQTAHATFCHCYSCIEVPLNAPQTLATMLLQCARMQQPRKTSVLSCGKLIGTMKRQQKISKPNFAMS